MEDDWKESTIYKQSTLKWIAKANAAVYMNPNKSSRFVNMYAVAVPSLELERSIRCPNTYPMLLDALTPASHAD